MDAQSLASGLRRGMAVALGIASLSGCWFGDTPASGGSLGGTGPGAGGSLDPRGTDASFTFSWWINGQDPLTASNDPCALAGVQYIRMGVASPDDPSQTFNPFQWDCHLGTFTPAQPDVRAGTFDVFWEAVKADGSLLSIAPAQVDASGNVVPAPEAATFTLGSTYNFDLGNSATGGGMGHATNFSTGSGPLVVSLSYLPATVVDGGVETDGGPIGMAVDASVPGDLGPSTDVGIVADAGGGTVDAGNADGGSSVGGGSGLSCAQAGVATITWQLIASNGVVVENHTAHENCGVYEVIQWMQVNWDNYSLAVTAMDATGNVVVQGTCDGLLAGPGATVSNYPCVVRPGI